MHMGRVAQVEMGVEVDDADPRGMVAGEVLGQAGPAAEGHFVAAAEHHGEMAGIQQRADVAPEAGLGRFQVAVLADHVASIVGRRLAVPGQVGQGLAHRQRRGGGADPTMVAAHALVAGEAEQGQARLAVAAKGANALVPARAVRLGVGTPAPGLHGMAISVHERVLR
jgi:hypothetical protein